MLSICCNREMLEEDTHFSAAKTFLLLISYKGKGGGGGFGPCLCLHLTEEADCKTWKVSK